VKVSDANLATAIMLTSLEIISPSTFGVSVPWQKHLNIARRIIRYGANYLQPVSRDHPIPYFLHLWLAYIDVIGSLSSRVPEESLFATELGELPQHDTLSIISDDNNNTSSSSINNNDSAHTIECMLGFTSHCVPIIAQIGNLARLCSPHRCDPSTGQIDPTWQPSPAILLECSRLEGQLERSRTHPANPCRHYSLRCDDDNNDNDGIEDDTARAESAATNDAFHRAALIHLLRRVRNLPRGTPAVQHAVAEIVTALERVRPGGSAEACLLFPMFTAGVEAEDQRTRGRVLERVRSLEGGGMMQVGRARAVLERVWVTGGDWEGLAQGEFFG
jgi:Fungal specific transcription factor domain